MIGDRPMRRFDAQIHDRELIREILDQIMVVHIGVQDGDYPYIVPLYFGYEITEDKLLIYVHGAREGHKIDLWKKNPKVSLTFSMFTNHPGIMYKGNNHDYRSIMANGLMRKVERNKSGGQHGRAVQAILRHYGRGRTEFSVPHYMFMDIYVAECDWSHVTAKAGIPFLSADEVAFPDRKTMLASTEPPCDYGFFFCRKPYEKTAGAAISTFSVPDGLPDLPAKTDIRFPADARLSLRFFWQSRQEQMPDYDVIAFVLDQDGKIPRRYDIAFYNQTKDRSGMVCHLGDDILQTDGQEELWVDLEKAPEFCGQVLFLLTTYEADTRAVNLDDLSGIGLEIRDRNTDKKELAYAICPEHTGKKTMVLATLTRQDDGSFLLGGPNGAAYDVWRATDLFPLYGLVRWKE
ncbi:MAG: TerD family protein [Clostridiales bacterium]|nr:TerD family protein [Clostridiales bacterium]